MDPSVLAVIAVIVVLFVSYVFCQINVGRRHARELYRAILKQFRDPGLHHRAQLCAFARAQSWTPKCLAGGGASYHAYIRIEGWQDGFPLTVAKTYRGLGSSGGKRYQYTIVSGYFILTSYMADESELEVAPDSEARMMFRVVEGAVGELGGASASIPGG